MAYDERLAERVRKALAGRKGISERKMFGGLAFLADGKMCLGVLNDELVVRVGPERHAQALQRPNARPMDFTGRPMRGMVYVAAAGLARGAALQRWVELGLAGARDAPVSKARGKRKTARARGPRSSARQ